MLTGHDLARIDSLWNVPLVPAIKFALQLGGYPHTVGLTAGDILDFSALAVQSGLNIFELEVSAKAFFSHVISGPDNQHFYDADANFCGLRRMQDHLRLQTDEQLVNWPPSTRLVARLLAGRAGHEPA